MAWVLVALAIAACVPAPSQEQPGGTATLAVPSPTGSGPSPSVTPRPPATSPTVIGTLAPITVAGPTAGVEVRSPVSVRGTASVFEAHVQVAVKNARGEVVGQGFTTASVGAPERGDYAASISFTVTGGRQNGTVEVFSPSARDGMPQHLVSVPVVLLP